MSYSLTSSDTRRPGGLHMTPGRIAALVIGVPVVLSLIAFTSLSFVADLGQASYPVSYHFPVQGDQVVADIDGNVTLQQAQVSEGELKGTAHYSLFRSTVTEEGGTVRYNCPFQLGNCSLNGTLQVPKQAAVALSTAGGDLSVGSFTGNLKLNTDGGNVNVSSLTGKLQISTSGGDVSVGAVITADPLQLTTDGGNITGQFLRAPRATVQTAGGDISLAYSIPPTNLTITADGGNVTLVLPHSAAKYQVNASSDGGNVNIDKSVRRDALAGNVIQVHTGGGDINISEAS